MEQLTQIEVSISSVSRKEQTLFKTAAAAYVITHEDISRSTADSIPELLRTVPGLQVAQINASTWAVSARGFNSAFATKLLVLVDGRTVYSEIYSGEHWDEIDLPLEVIERIEIIRGPGAVVWGTNAVNGVINIITRPARAVSGTLLSGRVSRINNKVFAQQSGTVGNDAQYQDFFSFTDRRSFVDADGTSAFGGEDLYRIGARLDWRKNDATTISLFGDAYGGLNRQETVPLLYPVALNGADEHDLLLGGSALLRIAHETTRNSYELQTYASSADRHELGAKSNIITENVDFIDHIQTGKRIDLVTGGELRLTQDFTQAQFPITRKPSYRNYLVDGFVQGEFNLLPNRLMATLGSKVQNGTLAGFQLQPSARLAYTVDRSQFFWAAISRSAVAPALQDKDVSIGFYLGTANGLPVKGQLTGNPDFKPETVVATEVGYRKHLGDHLSFDLAAYSNATRRLQSIEVGQAIIVTSPSPLITVPLLYVNGYSAQSQGVETSLEWRKGEQLELRGNYSWIEAQLTPARPGLVSITDGLNSARNTFAGTGNWTFIPHWQLKGMLYSIGTTDINGSSAALRFGSGEEAVIPRFTRLDLAVEHHMGSRLSVSAGGTNLASARHREFGGFTTFLNPQYVPRSLFLRGSWNF